MYYVDQKNPDRKRCEYFISPIGFLTNSIVCELLDSIIPPFAVCVSSVCKCPNSIVAVSYCPVLVSAGDLLHICL